jgi:hypothetical protein
MTGYGLLMNEDVRVLFHELAGLPPAQRDDHYVRLHVAPNVRAELESLLSFDTPPGDSLGGVVGSVAEQLLLSNAPVAEGGRCGS